MLAPELQRVIGWNEIEYSNLVNAFQAAYAIGLLVAGGFMDRVGTRIGYAVAIGVWSIATMGTALVHTVLGFGIARFVLGLGESGNFPASIKTVAEWFPKRERAFATGIFNSGANIGAVVAPIVVPWLTVHYGWQAAFLVTGSLSALWLIPWLIMYRPPQQHPRLSKAELSYILSDPPEPVEKIPWAQTARAPADLGLRHWKIHDGPHLVVHHVLAAEIFELALRIVAHRAGLAAGDRL